MRRFLPAILGLLLTLLTFAGLARAQGPTTGQINQLNIAVTPTCAAQSLSQYAGLPYYKLYMDYTGELCVGATVTATATTTATASSTPTAVSAGPGAPLNIDLHSSLFVQPTFAGTPVDATHGLPTNCISGCSGGPADESAFTPGTTPTVTGGFFQTTATNNALTNLQAGSVQMTAQRAFFVNFRNASGAELGVAAAPVQVSLANTASNAAPVTIAGAVTNAGTFAVQDSTTETNTGTTATNTGTIASAVSASVMQSNTKQVNGVTTLAGAGAVGTGAQRMAVGQDTTTIAGSAPGTAGSASANVVTVQGVSGGTTLPTQQSSQYPVGAVAETASATGTTGATTATLATNTGQTTSICGFSIRANATAAATGNATVTGTITGTLNFTQWTAPLASGLGVTEMIFTPCVPASTTNTSIAVVSAAPGTGGVVSVSAWGFLK